MTPVVHRLFGEVFGVSNRGIGGGFIRIYIGHQLVAGDGERWERRRGREKRPERVAAVGR